MNKRELLAPKEGAAAPQTIRGAKWREKMDTQQLAGVYSKQVETENREGTEKAKGGKKVHSINMSL